MRSRSASRLREGEVDIPLAAVRRSNLLSNANGRR